MARKPPPLRDFDTVVREALDDMIEHGFDGTERVAYWEEQLRRAAESSMTPSSVLENDLREALAQAYRRDIDNGLALKRHPGVGKFTLEKMRPELQRELHKRILASASLIRLDRERVITQTVQRFGGWATSVPAGGSKAADKKEEKEKIRAGMAGLRFKERRVLIDQTHKLNAAVNDVIAKGGGAIGAHWRSHYHQAGYDFREDHKDREIESKLLPYLIKGSWADELGYVKLAGSKWLGSMTQAGEEIFCRCYVVYIYNLSQLPREMLTAKGTAKLAEVRERMRA